MRAMVAMSLRVMSRSMHLRLVRLRVSARQTVTSRAVIVHPVVVRCRRVCIRLGVRLSQVREGTLRNSAVLPCHRDTPFRLPAVPEPQERRNVRP